ncbi:MAG: restriction endonuclease subunit S [Calditrichia bacterium]
MSVTVRQNRASANIAEENVSSGYKRTEVGVIPEDWSVVKLKEIAKIETGSTPSTNVKSYYGDDYLFVSPLDIKDRKYITNTEKKLSKKGFNITPHFPKNSILFVCIGSTIGKCAIASTELTSNQQINAVFPSQNFSSDYLYYALLLAAPKVKAMSGEQAVPIVNKSQFSETLIPLPPLPEQRAIAGALSDVDKLIESLDKLIVKKKAIKQAAMQQLLTGKMRLPGFSGEWEVRRLGEIGNCLRGVSYNGQYDLVEGDTKDSIRLLRANNISEETINLNDLQYVKEYTVNESQLLRDNDIVICMANGSKELVGKAALFKNIDGLKYTFGAFMGCFRINFQKANPYFIFGLFNTLKYRNYLKILLSGSSINNLKPSDIESLEFEMPDDKHEQDNIAYIISDMDAEIQALERRREKIKQIKQGMMQVLLTGKVRLM